MSHLSFNCFKNVLSSIFPTLSCNCLFFIPLVHQFSCSPHSFLFYYQLFSLHLTCHSFYFWSFKVLLAYSITPFSGIHYFSLFLTSTFSLFLWLIFLFFSRHNFLLCSIHFPYECVQFDGFFVSFKMLLRSFFSTIVFHLVSISPSFFRLLYLVMKLHFCSVGSHILTVHICTPTKLAHPSIHLPGETFTAFSLHPPQNTYCMWH